MFLLLPRTVAFKSPHSWFYRRFRGVVKAELVGFDKLRLTNRRGKRIDVPYQDSVIVYGKRVPMPLEKS